MDEPYMLPTKPIRDWLDTHKVWTNNTVLVVKPAPRSTFLTWIKKEEVTVLQADAMCIEWLGVHPTYLYGDDFWIGLD